MHRHCPFPLIISHGHWLHFLVLFLSCSVPRISRYSAPSPALTGRSPSTDFTFSRSEQQNSPSSSDPYSDITYLSLSASSPWLFGQFFRSCVVDCWFFNRTDCTILRPAFHLFDILDACAMIAFSPVFFSWEPISFFYGG